jgi:predicted nuclease with TOPRIM domain
MDAEEYVTAQQVIADGHKGLVVQALEESIEELRGEIDFLKEENKRLRNVSRATRTSTRKARDAAKALFEQVEEMGQHIMDIAAEEAETESGSTSASDLTT